MTRTLSFSWRIEIGEEAALFEVIVSSECSGISTLIEKSPSVFGVQTTASEVRDIARTRTSLVKRSPSEVLMTMVDTTSRGKDDSMVKGMRTPFLTIPKVGVSMLRSSKSGSLVGDPTGMAKIGVPRVRYREVTLTGGAPAFQSPSETTKTPMTFEALSRTEPRGLERSVPSTTPWGGKSLITTLAILDNSLQDSGLEIASLADCREVAFLSITTSWVCMLGERSTRMAKVGFWVERKSWIHSGWFSRIAPSKTAPHRRSSRPIIPRE